MQAQFRAHRRQLVKLFNLAMLGVAVAVGIAIGVLNIFGLPGSGALSLSAIAALVSLTLIYLVTERTSILDELHKSLAADRTVVFKTRDENYSGVVSVITEVGASRPARQKTIFVCGLHRYTGTRRPDPPSSALRAFDNALSDCILSSGTDMWRVRALYNITTERGLNEVCERLERWEDADGFEYRCFVLPGMVAQLSPLIVGFEHTFIGLSDPRYHPMREGILVVGPHVNEIMRGHFDSLWNDSRAHHLRPPTGLDYAVLDRVRAEIKRLGEARPNEGTQIPGEA